jgi:maltooligosyltrehalose trehalohydrolase
MLTKSFNNSLELNVWAPEANSCAVSCSGVKTTLSNNAGYFSGAVSCSPGSKYNLIFDGSLSRIDPLALDVMTDMSASIVPQSYSFNSPQVFIDKSRIVIYEMHIASFTSAGTFDAAIDKLDYLAGLGVTMLELMPIFHFCGDAGGWGYNPCAPWAIKPE